jgi:hypothetical protein
MDVVSLGEPVMRTVRNRLLIGLVLLLCTIAAIAGCTNTPVDTSSYAQGPAPLRMPSPEEEEQECQSYEDSLTGGKVFTMYCSYCHNAPSLAERPYSQFRNVAAHMRVRANLTGKEYAKLMAWLRRWHDVPPQNPPDQPSPKRFIYSQPIAELAPQPTGKDANPVALPQPKELPKP